MVLARSSGTMTTIPMKMVMVHHGGVVEMFAVVVCETTMRGREGEERGRGIGERMKTRASARKECVVTVGTTRFDQLIQVVSGETFPRILRGRGFDRLVLQIGSGDLPRGVRLGDDDNRTGEYTHECGLEVSWFRFQPEFRKVISQADLVVSHAGSGSIFEALGAQRNLIVVVNTKLMDNHQQELAERLCQDGENM